MSQKVLLAILDGWGLGKDPGISAIAKAKTPFMDCCYKKFPNTMLAASGLEVGLPAGQMGNSEVGHMNLGAGRVVYQNLTKLNLSIENKTLGNEKILKEAFAFAKENDKNVHFIGLLSDGGVHSHISHLEALLDIARDYGLGKVFVHAFTDGRDCDPKGGIRFIKRLQSHMSQSTGRLSSVVGRFFAMDRDQRWERIKTAYDAMVSGIGTKSADMVSSIQSSYEKGITDEFIEPIISVDEKGNPIGKIESGDVVVCFNFRTDRGREITEALTQKDFPDFGMEKLNLYYVSLTNYDETYKDVKVVFDKEILPNTLGEALEDNGKTQIRIAETEKYPHVTFFFSGGREEAFSREKRILCPSPKKVKTYDQKPEMSAYDITHAIIPELEKETADFVCLNFANPDMVGHTGNMQAAIKACQVVDSCIEKVATAAYENNYTVLILADHGNSEVMLNADGSVNTSHTTNVVPLIIMDKNKTWKLKKGKLGDVAPTILKIMNLDIPIEMTGDILVS